MAISSARFSPKTDNNRQAFAAKVQIRSNVMAQIDRPAVFDAFAGSGQMFTAVWHTATAYTGCDLKWARDSRTMFAADNRRVLRAIDLAPFNLFDLDAYGSPWEQALIIASRRRVQPGERIGFVLTERNGFAYKSNVMPIAIRVLTGLKPGVVGLSRKQDDVIRLAIRGLVNRMRCGISAQWVAEGKTGASMRYIGLVLTGIKRPDAATA